MCHIFYTVKIFKRGQICNLYLFQEHTLFSSRRKIFKKITFPVCSMSFATLVRRYNGIILLLNVIVASMQKVLYYFSTEERSNAWKEKWHKNIYNYCSWRKLKRLPFFTSKDSLICTIACVKSSFKHLCKYFLREKKLKSHIQKPLITYQLKRKPKANLVPW